MNVFVSTSFIIILFIVGCDHRPNEMCITPRYARRLMCNTCNSKKWHRKKREIEMEQDRNNNMGSSDAFEGLKRLTEMLYENKKKNKN